MNFKKMRRVTNLVAVAAGLLGGSAHALSVPSSSGGTTVPEPGTLALLGIGLLIAGVLGRRKAR